MGEKNDFTKEFEVPGNYYVDINGGPSMTFGHLKNSQYGECYIGVYKSLDRGHGSPPVEHLISVGNFVIKDTQDMKVSDFLREVRQGIEEIIDSEGKLPINISPIS